MRLQNVFPTDRVVMPHIIKDVSLKEDSTGIRHHQGEGVKLNSSTPQLAGQIERAMRSRVAIEQAKGMLSVQADINMDQAFTLMTNYGRRHSIYVTDIAKRILDRKLSAADLVRGIEIPPQAP